MKIYILFFLFLLLNTLKAQEIHQVPQKSTEEAMVTSFVFGKLNGTLRVKVPINDVKIPAIVHVTQIGSYAFSTNEANGIVFSCSGVFTTTGTQSITLLASGTPISEGYYKYTLQNTLFSESFSVPTLDSQSVLGAAGKIWMAYNLGANATATSATDFSQYGWLYQWGRGNDGHQLVNWISPTTRKAVNGKTRTLSTTDDPGHSLFITTEAGINDWRNPKNDNLWQGVDGINNPCPTGFRLPTDAEWTAEVTAAGITDGAKAYESSLKLVLAGYRNFSNGIINGAGRGGDYWSSTVKGPLAYYRVFFKKGTGNYTVNRAIGFSVRCLKDK